MTNKERLFSLSDDELMEEMKGIDDLLDHWACNVCKLERGLNAPCFCHPAEDFKCPKYTLTSFLNAEELTDKELTKAKKIREAGYKKFQTLRKAWDKEREKNRCLHCAHKNVCKIMDCNKCADFDEEKRHVWD